ncbi:MAG: ACP phosphodiesterase [Bacteroidales bacterium]
MNFLAHLYLSGDDPDLIIGNFIADMVKGQQINGYHSGIIRGIRLHRMIDDYTDQHPVVEKSKDRLRKKYRLYAGVVVDMYYDHFLAVHWSDYSDYRLDKYVSKAYALLNDHFSILPSRVRYILPKMIEYNWLVNYADLECLRINFGGMARRTPFESGMSEAVNDLEQYYSLFENEFSLFFPELIRFVEQQGVSQAHHRG